jgi:hypothetical protein
MPEGQLMHALDPDAEYSPAAQLTQLEDDDPLLVER